MSESGFPRYDRANVPDAGCSQCEALRREVKLTREKNARLRNEVRWLQGLPPKNTNQQIAQRDRHIRALQSTCETYKSSVAGYVKHTATLAATIDRVKRERNAIRAQLAAAEAAREAVLASLAAAEAVAGEVRGEAAKAVCHYCRVGAPFVETPYVRNGRWHQNDVDPLVCSWCSASAIHALPTPSAALQRVREQEAERALRWAADHPCGTGGLADLLGVVADDPRDQWAGYVKRGLAALFPTPDAGGK